MDEQYKGLLLILDGLGDRPHPRMGGKTPLETAHTPTMDALLQQGLCGMMDPLMPGVPVSTHTGTAILLGMPSADAARLERGPVEAMGIELETHPEDILLRCNFAYLQQTGEQLIIKDRRAGRISTQTDILAQQLQDIALSGDITACLCPATQHRATLRLRGSNLSTKITDTDPGSGQNVALPGCQPTDPADPSARKTAAAINQFIQIAHQRLQQHPVNRQREADGLLPANGLITRGAGKPVQINSLIRHLGLKCALISSEATVIGAGKMLGYQTINNPRYTADVNSDIEAKFQAASDALTDHDLVAIHIKGTDICAHDLDPQAKCQLIERIDSALSKMTTSHLVIGITGDHSTDSNTGRHTGDPVPSLLSGPNMRQDSCTEYSESACLAGGIGRISGSGFFTSLLDAMNRLNNLKPSDCDFILP